ncbi:Tubulin polyglutamylase ttll5 [Dinochytrium kinnereticum]|nr:Tubulin polyglutamylase ttll5 [Dinochytrium kinnereticum]
MSRALSVTTNKPKHLVELLNQKLASVSTPPNPIPSAAEPENSNNHKKSSTTPRGHVLHPDAIALAAGPQAQESSFHSMDTDRRSVIDDCEPPTSRSKKRSVTWRDSVGDSLCEEARHPNDTNDDDDWSDRPSEETFAGFHNEPTESTNNLYPVHTTRHPPTPPPPHLGLPQLQWSTGPTPIPRLRFTPVTFLITQRQASRLVNHPSVSDGDVPMRLSFRIVGGCECQIVRATLVAHGFREAGPTQDDFNLLWANGRVEVHEIRGLNRFQKVNRFPRTNEITRKDKMYLNISRMRQTYGDRHFDFLPTTFLLPQEYEPFYTSYLRTGGRWIVKPVASSQGRGIHVIDSLAELPSRLNADDKYLIQKYIDNPLLLDGYKFDLRIYVAITSFSPLRIYMFEEGLARVATEKYDTNPNNSNRNFMHLTNSSINKQSENYVDNEDASHDDHGHKWSLTALMRYITSKYGSDNASLIKSKIKDIIVKSILSGEATVATAVNMFVQNPGNCFELLGFDILIDENLTPWLLEVNMSPSLSCDTPLDLKIKSALIADLFTMIGMIPFQKGARRGSMQQPKPYRPPHGTAPPTTPKAEWTPPTPTDQKLTPDQQRHVRLTKDEHARRGRFTRIFPTDTSAYLYSSFISKSSINWVLLMAMFGKNSLARPKLRCESPSSSSSVGNAGGRGSVTRFNPVGAWSECFRGKGRSLSSSRESVAKAPWAPGDDDMGGQEDHGGSDTSSVNWGGDSSKFFTQQQPGGSHLDVSSLESTSSTEDLLSGASVILSVVAGKSGYSKVASSSSTVQSKKLTSDGLSSAKKVAEKIQAREAFHVFLENILDRLRRHYEQTDPDAKMDENDIRQQVAIVDKFLAQARELSIDTDTPEPFDPPTEIKDMPALTDRLEEFLKSYKRQTEKFKLECLANGKISGTTNAWTPQSACSSRHSSRPNSASKLGRTPNRSITPSSSSNGEDYASIASSERSHDPSPKQKPLPIRSITVVPSNSSSSHVLQHHLAQAQSSSTRGWASPALSSRVASAFPVAYAWSSTAPAIGQNHGATSSHSPLAASLARKSKRLDGRLGVGERGRAGTGVGTAKGSRAGVGAHSFSVQGAKYYVK